MKCPKCGTEQPEGAQCAGCGIFFEKYAAYLALKAARQSPVPAPARKPAPALRGPVPLFVAIALLLAGMAWFVLGRGRGTAAEAPARQAAAAIESPSDATIDAPIPGSIRERVNASHAPKNEIERARNATVFIQTEWGASGSGFIVDAGCRVITNRHVVQFDESRLRKDVLSSTEVQTAFKLRQQELLLELQRLRMEFQNALQTRASTAELLKMREEIVRRSSELDALPETFRGEIDSKLHDEAWKYRSAKLSVSLVDGSEFQVSQVRISEEYDLAAFAIDGVDCPFLVRGDPDNLAQGGQLFTIGNPSGLTYTVTSGVFSGFREEDGQTFLQTDAPINPGNSGGPLIDPQGRVVGINTMVLRNAQSIGFSIPVTAIDLAFR